MPWDYNDTYLTLHCALQSLQCPTVPTVSQKSCVKKRKKKISGNLKIHPQIAALFLQIFIKTCSKRNLNDDTSSKIIAKKISVHKFI